MWKYLKNYNPSMKDYLPQESGPLSRSVPSSAIVSANKAVLKSLEDATKQEKRVSMASTVLRKGPR